MKATPGVRTARTLVHVALIAASLVTLTPFVWLVASTLKTNQDLFHYTFFAPTISFQSYRDLLRAEPSFLRSLMNSTFVACTIVSVQLFFSSLAGFALAKYEFKGKKQIMIFMLATMLIPGQVTLAPLYALIYKLHLLDTYTGLIIPGAVNVLGIFLFRQSILQVPDELLQAARIDGCSEFRIYWNIVMPVTRPMIGAFCLLGFMGAWNSWLWPQILLQHSERFTLPIFLNQFRDVYAQQYGALMAGTLLSVLPVIVLFLVLQKEFVAGLTSGAVKG